MSNLQDLDFIKLWLDPKTGKTWFVNGNGQWQEYSLPSGGGGSEAGSGLTQDGSKIDLRGVLTNDAVIDGDSEFEFIVTKVPEIRLTATNVEIVGNNDIKIGSNGDLSIGTDEGYLTYVKGGTVDIESDLSVNISAGAGVSIYTSEDNIELGTNNTGALILPIVSGVENITNPLVGAVVVDNSAETPAIKFYTGTEWKIISFTT